MQAEHSSTLTDSLSLFCSPVLAICDPTLEKGPYGANYDIELQEQKDEELKFWRNCFYHIDML